MKKSKSAGAVADAPSPVVTPPVVPKPTEREFVTTAELQRHLPLSRRSLFAWRRKGWIPSIVAGSKIIYHLPSVREALLRRQSGGAL